MLAALGVTILRIGQLLNPHMFLGMALLVPVGLKMATTGYRFVRYYTGSPSYRRKGPPRIEMRLLAPAVVARPSRCSRPASRCSTSGRADRRAC